MDPRFSDKDLLIQFGVHRKGHAFDELVRRWDYSVLAYLTKVTGDAEASKDLRQEVFIRLYRFGHTYDPAYAFTTWFFRVVRNVLADWHTARTRDNRRRARLDGMDSGPVLDARSMPDHFSALKELGERIHEALDRCRPEERELFLLRLDQGLTFREIALICEIPEPTAKSRFYACVKKVQAYLQKTYPEICSDMPRKECKA